MTPLERALAIARPHTCTTDRCGVRYGPGVDERQRHRAIYGHTPSRDVAAVEPHRTVGWRCADGAHGACGGVLIVRRKAIECACACHEKKGNAS